MESIWHFELYRVLCNILPDNIYISPEVGKAFCDNGSIDLYIPFYCWGIELLVDGYGMKEHYLRFQAGNKYLNSQSFLLYKDINLIFNNSDKFNINVGGKYSSIPIKEYLLVDIRQTVKVKKLYLNTWHVNPDESCSSFEIMRVDKNGVEVEFTIHVNNIKSNRSGSVFNDNNNGNNSNNSILFISIAILVTIVFILSLVIVFLLIVIFKKADNII